MYSFEQEDEFVEVTLCGLAGYGEGLSSTVHVVHTHIAPCLKGITLT